MQTLLNRVDQAVLFFSPQGGPDQTPNSPPSGKFSSQLYGTLHLLLCLLRNKKVKSEIDPYFSRTFAENLVRTLLNLIKSYEESSCKNILSDLDTDVIAFWPQWISPLCVLLYELVTASLSVTEIVMASVINTEMKSVSTDGDKKDDSEEKTETVIAEEKECEVGELNNEVEKEGEKEDERDNEREREGEREGERVGDGEEKETKKEEVDEAELSLELGGILRDEVEKSSLLSEGSWVIIFETVSRILHSSSIGNTLISSAESEETQEILHQLLNTDLKSDDEDIPNLTRSGPNRSQPARYLDPSSSQGVLLLLHTLISKQKLSVKFVVSGGRSEFTVCLFCIPFFRFF